MYEATATSVDGARGANGVILMETKEVDEGNASVSLRMENSLSTPTRNVELADPVTYMRLHNESILTRDPLSPLPYSRSKIDNTTPDADPYLYPETDWREQLMKDYTTNQRVHLNVSGVGKVGRSFESGTLDRKRTQMKHSH